MKNLNQKDFAMKIVREIPREKNVRRKAVFECKSCKKHIEAFVHNMNKKGRVNSGMCKSCATIFFHTTHGEAGKVCSKLYNSWRSMVKRCTYHKTNGYENYGGRGITVFEDWKIFENFKKWAIETNYQEGLTIERINVNGNYEPSNCKWITKEEQTANKRLLQKNNKSGYRGVHCVGGKYASVLEINGKKERLLYNENPILCARARDIYIIVHKLQRPLNFGNKLCINENCIHRFGCILHKDHFIIKNTNNFDIFDGEDCINVDEDEMPYRYMIRFRNSDGSKLKK